MTATSCIVSPEQLARNGGLKEYSVVYTDRSLNHMSEPFGEVMRDLSAIMKRAYKAHSVALVPGGGSYAMEAIARQFAHGASCASLRNGNFSFRWSAIFEGCAIPGGLHVLPALPVKNGAQPFFAPHPLERTKQYIAAHRPQLMIAPHVETSLGMNLSEDYTRAVADAVHDVGGLMVLDGIAAGAVWLDMERTGVDIYIFAPQKGWSGPPCAGIVMLSERARRAIDQTKSSSFVLDLRKWLEIMETFETGKHAYLATMPTESLRQPRDSAAEFEAFGFEQAEKRTWELSRRVRRALEQRGFKSVAAPGFQAPGVVVSYADTADLAEDFRSIGIQISPGVPFMLGEPEGLKTFRIGLFGIDKLRNVEEAASTFELALDKVCKKRRSLLTRKHSSQVPSIATNDSTFQPVTASSKL